MNRREFMTYSAALAGGLMLGSCAPGTSRYTGPSPVARMEEKLVLKNVSIVDVETGKLARQNNILLQNGLIAYIFEDSQWPNVQADRVLDLGKAFVMPGMINAHCHMTAPCGISMRATALFVYQRQVERNAEECIKHGVTTVRDMLSVSDWISGVEWLQERIAHNKIAGPRIIRSCAIDIDNGYSDFLTAFSRKKSWKQVSSVKEARRAVRSAAATGADFIKLFQQRTKLIMPCDEIPLMSQELINAICEEAARNNMPVAMHHTEIVGMEKGIAGGVTSLEHMASDGPITDETIRILVDNETYMVPTAMIAYAFAFPMNNDPNWGSKNTLRIEELRRQTLPGLLNEFCEPEFARGSMGFYKKFSDPKSYEKTHLIPWPCPRLMNASANQGADNTLILHEAGVNFGCGNDGGVPFSFPGAIGFEMMLLEELGIKTPELLKMVTINNARLLGLEKKLGTIKSPKIADLVVFTKNPLESAKNTFKPKMVFQKGRLVYEA